MNVRSWVALTAVAAFALVAGCGGKGAAGEGGGGFPPTAVTVGVVQPQLIRNTSEYVSEVKSRHSVDVQPQVDGYVRKIVVRPGDRVAQGALLMQIDPQKQLQAVRNMEATRSARLAALRLAEQQKKRADDMYKSGVMSKQDLDQAAAALAASQADVNALDAQVAGEKVQLRYYAVTAPAAGVVGDVPVREGDLVTPSTRVTTIDQNSALEAYIPVPIERAPQLHRGLDIEIVDDSDKVVATGKVDFIAPRVSDTTQSVLAKAPIANVVGPLRTSQFTNARVIWSARQAPVVPTSAVLRLGGSPFIFVVEGEGKSMVAKQRAIELGELSGDVYEVKSGIANGDRIVTSGIQKLRDGAPIVVEAPAPPKQEGKP